MRVFNAPHEPFSLALVRLIALIFIFCVSLGTILTQLFKVLDPTFVYQSQLTTRSLPVPAIIFRAAMKNYNRIRFEHGNYRPRFDTGESFSESSFLTSLLWGKDVINSQDPADQWVFDSEGAQVSPTSNDTMLFLKMLKPKPEVQFLPPAAVEQSRAHGNKTVVTYIDLRFSILPSVDENRTLLPPPAYSMDIFLIDNEYMLRDLRDKRRPIDISGLSNIAQFRLPLNSSSYIGFTQKFIQENGNDVPIYETQMRPNPLDNSNAISFIFGPMNPVAINGSGYIVETMIARQPYTWYDFAGNVGGACSLAIAFYTLLFGQRRLRPWGVIQRYLIRNSILSRLPQHMKEVGPPAKFNPADESSAGTVTIANSAFHCAKQSGLSGTLVQMEARLRALEVLPNLNSAAHNLNAFDDNKSTRSDEASLLRSALQQQASHVAVMQTAIDRHEAFHQRMSTFYLSADLFRDSEDDHSRIG